MYLFLHSWRKGLSKKAMVLSKCNAAAILGSNHVLALTTHTCSSRHLELRCPAVVWVAHPLPRQYRIKVHAKAKEKVPPKANDRIIALHLLLFMVKAFLEARVLFHIKARDLQKVRFLRVKVRDPILASRYQRWCVVSVIYMATINRIVARSMRFKIQILTNKLGVNLTLGNSY